MKVYTAALTGAALDWAVAMSEGATELHFDTVATHWFSLHGVERALGSRWGVLNYSPSSNWNEGGPIIERERIVIDDAGGYAFVATLESDEGGYYTEEHANILVAAMRCYVASKLGNTVEIPDVLISPKAV